MDTTALAARLIFAFHNIEAATRPIDRKTADARFTGMCSAADALGLAPTEFAVNLAVREAIAVTVADLGARPPFRAVDNQRLRDWDAHAAGALITALDWAV